MRSYLLFAAAAVLAAAASGCRTCDDRPRLFDRLFHRDTDDCPSRSVGASLVKPCNDLAMAGPVCGSAMVPQGYGPMITTPTGGAMPAYMTGPFTAFPTYGGAGPTPPSGPANELPPPSERLGPNATPVPTEPSGGGAAPPGGGRITGGPRN